MRDQRFARWCVPAALAILLITPACGNRSTDSSDSSTDSSSTGSTSTTVTISTQPASVKAAVGTAVTLTVAATGSGTLSYQWLKGGVAISGATSATYSIASLAAADAGRYAAKITDTNGSVTSTKAVVTPTSNGVAVDVWDLGDGFNPADDVSNVTFAYTVTLTGASDGITVAASGLSTSSSSGGKTTFSDGSKTVIVDTSATPITITSTITGGAVEYVLTGTFSTGIKLTSAAQHKLSLTNVAITSEVGPAINVASAVRSFVVLSGTSSLTDGSPASVASNAAFYTKGSLLFSGSGALTVTSGPNYESHAIQVKDHIRVSEGTLTIKTRYNPLTKDVNTSSVYAINAVASFVMDGGTVITTSADLNSNSAKTVPAGWGRGIGVKGAESNYGFIAINDGILTITSYDKAMTAKWKCYDKDTPSDSDGDGVCNTSDPNPFVTINGGTVTIRATGTPCDPTDRQTYNSTTCTGTSSTQVSPEGIEAKSILTINGGSVDVQTTDDAMNAGISYTNAYGNNIVINGGRVNAASSGNDGVDANAIASPGITITGGSVVANGIGAPEEGLDADQYTVRINGGTVIGTGGANSTVDGSSTADYGSISKITAGTTLAIWKGSSSSGSLVFAYQIPTTTTTSTLAALVSNSALVAGGTYSYHFTSSSNVTCSEWFHGLCVGTMSATYSSLGSGTSLTVK
jgi:hypothetical protein